MKLSFTVSLSLSQRSSLSPSPLSPLSLTVTALSSLSHRHRSLSLSPSPLSALSLSQLSALTLSPSLSPLFALSLSHCSLSPDLTHRQLSLSLTEISFPNPKYLSSLRLRLRRGCRVCRHRLPEIGASEALSRRRCSSHPNPSPQNGASEALSLGSPKPRKSLSQTLNFWFLDVLMFSCFN
ncbi:hypothetical protein Scep_027660 [Stephania cephalantha]|uniref:Uncharacterized protein n=1 Tax=Stephania cephalantha TaxID=152367 RepID=A0AAP0EBL5_9MAGN